MPPPSTAATGAAPIQTDEARLRAIIREEVGAANEPEPLLDVGGVARRLSVSIRSVEKLIAREEIVPIQVGGVRRFDPETIDAYIRRNVRGGRVRR